MKKQREQVSNSWIRNKRCHNWDNGINGSINTARFKIQALTYDLLNGYTMKSSLITSNRQTATAAGSGRDG